ncbi:hypothetical protein SVR5_00271 [Glaesserella parasuis 29755]|nr:hypothetical protein HS327_00519 [Glaesserella parasuis]CDH98822.1 hypothetical protein SVR5_00271 [Glaesserella parasuis 29755]STO80707.1 Uncharacterised protein [Glaesserella parasuis]
MIVTIKDLAKEAGGSLCTVSKCAKWQEWRKFRQN